MDFSNPYQPVRPDTYEGHKLAYRTHIARRTSKYDIFSPENIKAQGLLYRWARNDFKNNVAIHDLHQYLFYKYPEVSKRHMGGTILQAVSYKPQKLKQKSKRNPKARLIYCFHHQYDLIYGLEWMLSYFVRRLAEERSVEAVAYELDELANCPERDLEGVFWEPRLHPFNRDRFMPIDWEVVWDQKGYTIQDIDLEEKDGGDGPPELKSYE